MWDPTRGSSTGNSQKVPRVSRQNPYPRYPGRLAGNRPPPPDESGPGPTRPPPQGVFTVKESLGRGQRVNRVDGGKRRGVVAEEGQPRQREERVARGPRLSRTGGGPPPVAKGAMKLEKKKQTPALHMQQKPRRGGGMAREEGDGLAKTGRLRANSGFLASLDYRHPPKNVKNVYFGFFFSFDPV